MRRKLAMRATFDARNGGIRVEDAWHLTKGLFKAVQRNSGAGEGGSL